jgi:hypothetical protein
MSANMSSSVTEVLELVAALSQNDINVLINEFPNGLDREKKYLLFDALISGLSQEDRTQLIRLVSKFNLN